MSAFTGPLRVEHLDADWRLWRLLQDLIFEADVKGSGRRIVVPAGFDTDGASIPRVLWALLPPTGSYMRAAAVHDFLCECLNKGLPHPFAPTRAEADRQFLIAMKAIGVIWPVRLTLYLSVRAFVLWRGLV